MSVKASELVLKVSRVRAGDSCSKASRRSTCPVFRKVSPEMTSTGVALSLAFCPVSRVPVTMTSSSEPGAASAEEASAEIGFAMVAAMHNITAETNRPRCGAAATRIDISRKFIMCNPSVQIVLRHSPAHGEGPAKSQRDCLRRFSRHGNNRVSSGPIPLAHIIMPEGGGRIVGVESGSGSERTRELSGARSGEAR